MFMYLPITKLQTAQISSISQRHLKYLELELKTRGFSIKTAKSYLFHNKQFLDFVKKTLGHVSEQDVKNYIDFLLENHKPATVNLALSSIKFFFREVLEKDLNLHRILLELLYGSGLRVSEAVKLKIKDLDLKQSMGIVRKGKGRKDRYFIVPSKLKSKIEFYLKLREDENPFLFPSQIRNSHISVRTAQMIVKQAARKADIEKPVHPHTLRHSFATHLLEQGTNISIIQRLLGHAKMESTKIYLHISTQTFKKVKSPLDIL